MGNHTAHETYYTVKAAAEILKVSPDAIYRAVEQSRITFLRFGRAIRIPESAFEEFIHPAKPPAPQPQQWRAPVTRL